MTYLVFVLTSAAAVRSRTHRAPYVRKEHHKIVVGSPFRLSYRASSVLLVLHDKLHVSQNAPNHHTHFAITWYFNHASRPT